MRLDYQTASPETLGAVVAFHQNLTTAFGDPKLKALVDLRVSQINGCAYCVNQHSNEARALGESQQRLDCLTVWHEVPFFTDKERAAFAWAESVTRIETHKPDGALFEEVRRHFSEEELVKLTGIITLMNVWNRFAISFGKVPAKAP